MATVALLGASIDTNSGTHTSTLTPTLNDLMVVLTIATGNTSTAAVTDNQGGTYTVIFSALKNSSADTMLWHVRNQLVSSAVSTIYSHAPGTSTGGGLAVFRVIGMTRTGLLAVRQFAKQENQAAATPAPAFGTAVLTANACIGGIFNATNPAAMTPPASWTELGDSGYATPTTGYEAAHRNSGETGTTITWGSASASAFCSGAIELDVTGVPDDHRKSLNQAVKRSNI